MLATRGKGDNIEHTEEELIKTGKSKYEILQLGIHLKWYRR